MSARKKWVIPSAILILLIVYLWIAHAKNRALFQQVDSNDMTTRVEATRILLDHGVIPGALPSQTVITRSKVAPALAKIGDQMAVDALIKQLDDFEDAPRRWAKDSLVKVGDFAIPSLCQVLVSGSDRAKKGAVDALSQMGPETIPFLRKLISNPSARDNACIVLGNVGGALPANSPNAKRAFTPLIYAASNQDTDLANSAIPVLGDKQVKDAVDPLRLALSNDAVRKNAIIALGGIADSRATLDLVPFVKVPDVRVDTARALGQIADPRAAVPLSETLGVRNEDYRSAVVLALQRIGAPAAGVLVGKLTSPDVYVRRAAAQSLRGDAVPSTIPALKVALSDPDSEVRGAAAQALGWSGNTAAIPVLLGRLNDKDGLVVDSAVEALANIGAGAIPALFSLLSSADSTAALHASHALVLMDKPAAKSLLAALDDTQNQQLRLWAAVTLADMGDRNAVKKMQELYITASGDFKAILKRGLGQLGAPVPTT